MESRGNKFLDEAIFPEDAKDGGDWTKNIA
jgi:hypothetical protein